METFFPGSADRIPRTARLVGYQQPVAGGVVQKFKCLSRSLKTLDDGTYLVRMTFDKTHDVVWAGDNIKTALSWLAMFQDDKEAEATT